MDGPARYQFIGFAVISGVISLCSNSVLLIAPLRMSDLGLGYASIGGAMSAMAVGMIFVKLFIGRHSDLVGPKAYISLSLLGQSVLVMSMAYAAKASHYTVLLCGIGFFRGVFTSVNTSYTFDLANDSNYGKVYGNILAVTSLFASLGGVFSGFLYGYRQGKFALISFGALLMAAFACSFFVIPKKEAARRRADRLPFLSLLRGTSKYVYVFCAAAFVQNFATAPMWNFLIPKYCFTTLALPAAAVGVLMSLDELIASPMYIFVGRFIDRIKPSRFNILLAVITAASGAAMAVSRSAVMFMVFFLMCSASISCIFVGIPRERLRHMRMREKGFELALFSVSASLGDSARSNVLGRIVDGVSVQAGMGVFVVCYLLVAGLILYSALSSGKGTEGGGFSG